MQYIFINIVFFTYLAIAHIYFSKEKCTFLKGEYLQNKKIQKQKKSFEKKIVKKDL